MKILKIALGNCFKATNPTTDSQQKPIKKNLSPLEKSPPKDTFEISVGYVNDTHGQINNMMRILSGLDGDIVLSAGDNDIGDEKNKAIHRATFKFLNLGKVRATALGNHEMDTTQADLINSLKEYNGDILTVNMEKDKLENQTKEDIEAYGRAELLEHIKPSKLLM